MKWDLGRRGGVEDRRGLSGGAIAGGGGIGVIVIALIGYFLGVDPQQLTQIVNQAQGPTEQQAGVEGTPTDEEGAFADVVHTSANDVWGQIFQQAGTQYQPTRLIAYTDYNQSGCGAAQAAMGPFYCPTDKQIYIDPAFFNELSRRFGAPGDFAQAYVIAHEVGHHIQDLEGTLDKAQTAQASMGKTQGNAVQVGVELQADCYAGVWAARSGALEQGDIEEGMRAAEAIGDDMLTKGQVSPDNFTHGTSEQRMNALRTGLQSGQPSACNFAR